MNDYIERERTSIRNDLQHLGSSNIENMIETYERLQKYFLQNMEFDAKSPAVSFCDMQIQLCRQMKLTEKYSEDIFQLCKEFCEDMDYYVDKCVKKGAYGLSIVVIVRNEADIIEWIEYHLLVGVEHFYIYDNESTDGLEKKLQSYIERGIVTYLYFPGNKVQHKAYQHAVQHFSLDTKWLAILDGDEYIVPVEKGNVLEICERIEHFYNNQYDVIGHVGGIAINLRTYGTSGHKTRPNGLCIENFIRRAGDGAAVNAMIKTIVNPRVVTNVGLNTCQYRDGYYTVTEDGTPIIGYYIYGSHCTKLRINHYHSKSEDELRSKFMRGWPDQDHILMQRDKLERKVQDHVRLNNDVEDTIMLKYVSDVKRRMGER